MTEIDTMFEGWYVGSVSGEEVTRLEVWIRVANRDIEITNSLSSAEIQSAMEEFYTEYKSKPRSTMTDLAYDLAKERLTADIAALRGYK